MRIKEHNARMTFGGSLRSLTNVCLSLLDLTLQRKSKVLAWKNRHIVRPTLFERALAGREAPTVLDIGASFGNTVAQILDICPAATVFAFEPQPEQAKLIKEKFSSNRNVQVINHAVGAGNSRRELYISEWRPSSSLLPLTDFGRRAVPSAAQGEALEVEVVSLDDWCQSLEQPPESIDLIKVDTQGYEKQVIDGGQQVFRKSTSVIIETAFIPVYENQAVYDSLIPLMNQMGFAVEAVDAGAYSRADGQLLEVNVLFRRVKA